MQPALKKGLSDFHKRQQMRARLPGWLRLLMPILVLTSVFGLTALLAISFWSLHRTLHPDITLGTAAGHTVLLIFFPTFFGSMAPALLALNFVLFHIPPLRQIFDENTTGVPGASYSEAQRQLSKMAKVISSPALALALLGAIEPWAI